MKRYISYDCKGKFNSTIRNSNQKWNNKTYQCESENSHKFKKDYIQDPSTFSFEKSKYLKNVTDSSVIEFVEIIQIPQILFNNKVLNLQINTNQC